MAISNGARLEFFCINGLGHALAAPIKPRAVGRKSDKEWYHAIRKAVHELRAGMVWVNGYGAERCEMPWGGRNQSGHGRELSPQSLEIFLNTKAVHIGKWQ